MSDLRGLKEILRQMINADHERWHMLRDAVIAHCEQDADRIAALEAQLEQARAVLPCGHHHSLLLKSAETGGEPLYCSMCDCMSQRDDANEECGYRIKERDEARADVVAAAGELMVPMPEPGTDMSRVMIANALMRRERDEARASEQLVRDALAVWEGEHCGGHCQAAPCGMCDGTMRTSGKGQRLEEERDELKEALAEALAEVERLRADAERYQLLRRGQKWSVIDGIGDTLRANELDAANDAAWSQP